MKTKNLFSFTARWLLVPIVLLTLGVGSAWGTDRTIIIDGTPLSSTATSAGDAKRYGNSDKDSVTITFSAGAKQQSSSGDNKFTEKAILIGKADTYFYNSTAVPGTITKFELYANKGASVSVSVSVTFSKYPLTAAGTGSDTLYTQTLSTVDQVYDCSAKIPSGAKYFYYKVTNKYNSQVEARITYTPSGGDCTSLSTPSVTAAPNNSSINLSWEAVEHASSYTVTCINKSTGVAAGTVGSVEGSTTKTCSITGLTNGTEYTWSVMAVGDGSTYCADNTAASGDITPNVSYTVTWNNNGSEYTTTTVADGSKPVFPATPTSCDDESTTFYGWSTGTWSGKTDDISGETIYTSADDMPTVSGPVTYHAVFAKGSAGATLLSEDFASITAGDNTTTSGSSSAWSINDNFSSKDYAYQAGGAVKLGSGSYAGYLVTKQLTAAIGDQLTIAFKVKGWSSVEGQIRISGNASEFTTPSDIIYSATMSGSFESKSVTVTLTKANPYIKIATTANRAFIDDIVITKKGSCSDYMTTCAVCDYKVNIIKGSETNGTFVLSRSGEQATCNGGRVITVTPTPADHYRVASVTASAPSGAGSQGTVTVTGPVNGVYTVTYSNEAKGNSTVNVVFEAIPQHTITLVPAVPANGTTSLESAGTTSVTIEEGTIVNLRAIPNDCYSVSSITITPSDGYTELEDAGDNDYHITGITKNLSVAVVYAQRAQYTVTLDAGSGSVAGSTSITQSDCGNITLPAAAPSEACALEGWEFAGWSRTKVNIETTSAPVLIAAGSFAPTATEILYAVYKQGSGAAESYWIKVLDDNQLAVGDSVIIAADEYDAAMSTTQNKNNRGETAITKSTTGDTLSVVSSNVVRLVLQSGTTSGTWAFYDAKLTGYLYAAGNSDGNNYLRTQTTKDANGSWSISINSTDGVASLEAQGSNSRNIMRYNHGSSLFACYVSSGTQDNLCLYKRYSAETNNYLSIPSCIPCTSSSASLSSTSVSMTTGKNSIVTLASANTSAVVVTSEDPTIATVSVSGKDITINGIKEGETTIVVEQARDALDESGHCEVYLEISISVTTSTIEIIEWEPNAVIIEYDGADDANLVLGKEVEHGSKEGTVATELFFSKYFEAAGEDKLLGIFNGTNETINLSGYTLKADGTDSSPLDLSLYGQTPGQIAPKEEIILYRYGNTAYSKSCMDTIDGHETWNEITWGGMRFSGRHSIGMYKNGTLIDIIGATYSEAVGGHSAGDLVVLNKITAKDVAKGLKPSWGDESGFNAENCGDNINTKDIETNYGLSTNRCLLVRRNTVTSGANAVLNNVTSHDPDVDSLECASAFQTLCSEWVGFHVVGAGSAGSGNTCDGMSYVAGFDYSNFYVTMETFSDETTIGDYANGDGTYTLPIPHLDTLSCRLVRIQLAKDGNVIASSDPQVPIIVTTDKSTNDALFNQHSIDTCKVCDVVVRDKAKLTKAANGAANDRAELNTITVYSGSQLIVPSGATNMKINNLILRSLEDTVSTASFAGGIQFKGTGNKVYHSKRVKQDRWYWFCLPHACSTSKITWQDGTKATIGKDFHLKYYDGAQRAATQQGGCWKEYTGSTIQPGVGYILSVEQRVGHTYRELIFPMDTISEGTATKAVPVDDYGAGENITPNHKGWNLVGNPYMTYYQKSKINADNKNLPALTVGKLVPYDTIDASNPLRTIHTYSIDVSGGNNAPFITIPVNSGNSEYQQQAIMDYDLPPFMSYFVQIGNNTPVSEKQYVNFYKTDLTNSATNLLHAPAARKQQEDEQAVQIEPVWITLRMQNNQQENDETTLIISDLYSTDYEISSDLGKWFGDSYREYRKPVLYSKSTDGEKMVFQSLPDAAAEEWVSLGFWGYDTQPMSISIRRQNRKLDYVESVILHDKTANTYTELLEQDYTFSPLKKALIGSRFEVKVILNRPKMDVPTGINNTIANLYAYAEGSQKLVVAGLPEQATVWIYDALGHLLAHEETINYMRTYTLPCAGVYFVRVNSAGGQQTLRTIVK